MINLTKVTSTLNKNNTIWIRKEGHNYIMSEHYIFKTSKDIKGALLTKLINLLETIPHEGQGMQNRHGHIREMSDDEINNMLNLLKCKTTKSIDFTNLIHQSDNLLLSIFKGVDYIFINKKYIDIINLYTPDIEIFGSGRVEPIYFHKDNEEMMVLPVRIVELPVYLTNEGE